jgi:hypothetical protein
VARDGAYQTDKDNISSICVSGSIVAWPHDLPMPLRRPTDKSPTVKILKPSASEDMRVEVSPKGSPISNEEEIHALRARNKVLTDALKAIKETADKEAHRHYELVWFARNRSKCQIGMSLIFVASAYY